MNAMNDLGSLADLPTEYVEALASHNLVPLWPSLRGVLPPTKPRPNTRATHWAYKDIKPLLLQAGELTPIEKAERRVLVLATPATAWTKCKPAQPSIWACSCCCRASGHLRTATPPTRCA